MITKTSYLWSAFLAGREDYRFASKEPIIMNDKFLYYGSTAFAALALLLMLVNICLVNSNRNMQNELNQRQAEINNSGTLTQINQALLQALAQASIDNNDKDIRELLESQGFTLKAKAEKTEKSDNADTKKK